MILIRCIVLFCCLCIASLSTKAVPLQSDSPISIDADMLEVLQQESKAIFRGNVVAKQADMTLKSQKMTVYYDQQSEKSSQSALGALSRIDVEGKVQLVTPEESATAQSGRYDAVKDKVFLFGSVLLRRGNNVLNGSRLVYDMTTGKSLLSSATANGGEAPASSGANRVRGIFVPDKQK